MTLQQKEGLQSRIDRLIDLLADKTKCECTRIDNWCKANHKPNPILIGDVLERVDCFDYSKLDPKQYFTDKELWVNSLIKKWQPLGFTRSLQDIFEKEWEEVKQDHDPQGYYKSFTMIKQLTPQASELLIFLETVIVAVRNPKM